MIWNSFADFAAMGGYGFYVWGSFGVVAATLAAECLALRSRRHALRQWRALAGADTPDAAASPQPGRAAPAHGVLSR